MLTIVVKSTNLSMNFNFLFLHHQVKLRPIEAGEMLGDH